MESFEAAAQERKVMKARFFPEPDKTAIPTMQSISVTDEITSESEEMNAPNDDQVSVVESETAAVGNWDASNAQGIVVEGVENGSSVITIIPPEASADAQDTRPTRVSNQESTLMQVPGQSPEVIEEGAAHPGVSCDGCGKLTIFGVRWKCLVCENHDLCNDCHSSGRCTKGHAVNHRVLRLDNPAGTLLIFINNSSSLICEQQRWLPTRKSIVMDATPHR